MKNKKRTSVEWLSNQAYELFEQYSEGNFDRITLNKLMLEATEKANELHKEEIIHSYHQSWHFRDKPYETAEKHYKETYGGGTI